MSYDPEFLTEPVPLPRPVAADAAWVELGYTHFTVLLDPARRLAGATGVNIDGAGLLDLGRSGLDWYLDDRVPVTSQAGDELYARNDLDRGHLVRRRDPVWGAPSVAATANAETFCFTNAAPQVAAFNQSKDLWLGLEEYLLGHADVTDTRLTVLTGPVLDEADPVYRGVAVPRAFWKVAVWTGPAGLAATGYLLDQSDLLTALLDRERVLGSAVDGGGAGAGERVELGAYRTFQVPIGDLATTARLDLGSLPAVDRLTARPTASGVRPGPRELTSYDQVVR